MHDILLGLLLQQGLQALKPPTHMVGSNAHNNVPNTDYSPCNSDMSEAGEADYRGNTLPKRRQAANSEAGVIRWHTTTPGKRQPKKAGAVEDTHGSSFGRLGSRLLHGLRVWL